MRYVNHNTTSYECQKWVNIQTIEVNSDDDCIDVILHLITERGW